LLLKADAKVIPFFNPPNLFSKFFGFFYSHPFQRKLSIKAGAKIKDFFLHLQINFHLFFSFFDLLS